MDDQEIDALRALFPKVTFRVVPAGLKLSSHIGSQTILNPSNFENVKHMASLFARETDGEVVWGPWQDMEPDYSVN